MQELRCFEKYPAIIVILSNLNSLFIYAVGASILYGYGFWAALLYLLYCLACEVSVLRGSCVNCYYYGKICAFGKGKLCPLIFKKGDPEQFAQKDISLIKLAPDLLISVLPIAGGIGLLIMDFDWLIVVLLIMLILFTSAGNAFIRGSLACKYCKQRKIGCPAEKLFNKQQQQL